jgi:hypothetical protein
MSPLIETDTRATMCRNLYRITRVSLVASSLRPRLADQPPFECPLCVDRLSEEKKRILDLNAGRNSWQLGFGGRP